MAIFTPQLARLNDPSNPSLRIARQVFLFLAAAGLLVAGSTARGEEPFALIKPTEILAGGPAKDGIPALTHPKAIEANDADFLDAADRVIGVTVNGESRAYPLRILIWHEIVNDMLGETPIAVTYCPLCDSSLVFDRRVGGQTREFGVSGKLYRSNVLMYDRQKSEKNESLWSQLQMRAVVGPAAEAGLMLTLLSSELTSWGEWLQRHPETEVLSDKTGHDRNYAGRAYAGYFTNDGIGFGSHGAGNRRPDLKNKDRIVAARIGDAARVYVVKDVETAAIGGSLEDDLGGVRLQITPLPEADSIRIKPINPSETNRLQIAYSFWFAWEDLYPGVEIWTPDGSLPQ